MTQQKELSSRHRAIMTSLVYDGLTNAEAADKFNIAPATVSRLRQSPMWEKEEQKMTALMLDQRGRGKLTELVPEAINVLEGIMTRTHYTYTDCNGRSHTVNNSPATRLLAVNSILDRTGLSAKNAEKAGAEKGPVSIYLYAPGWHDGSKEGKVIEVEAVDTSIKEKKYD